MALRSRIPLIISELDDDVVHGVIECANLIVAGAKERVPIGAPLEHLRDAIHVEVEGDEIRVVAGTRDLYYGHIVEFGSEHSAPRPFLIPAFEQVRPLIETIVGEKLKLRSR